MGKLEKLQIEAYSTIEFTEKVGDPFTVLFNPEKYDEKFEIEYKEDQAQGTSSNAPKFGKMKPQEYQFEFILDGTGVVSDIKKITSVDEEVQKFLTVVYEYNGEEHRPNFCKIHWGRLLLKCNLKTCSISYTLFDSDGYPLRARIKATFTEVQADEERAQEQADSSPDLTHIREVKAGDTLPLMTYRIYKDIAPYPLVARYNSLKQFQKLVAGTELKFPPLEELYELHDREAGRLENAR